MTQKNKKPSKEEIGKIRDRIFEKINSKYEGSLERISTNDEWYKLHNDYLGDIVDEAISLTTKKIFAELGNELVTEMQSLDNYQKEYPELLNEVSPKKCELNRLFQMVKELKSKYLGDGEE